MLTLIAGLTAGFVLALVAVGLLATWIITLVVEARYPRRAGAWRWRAGTSR